MTSHGGDILQCGTYDDLLKWIRRRVETGAMNEVSRGMGYRSKGSLSMFLCGHRVLTRRGLAALSEYFSWSDLQRWHADQLVQKRLGTTRSTAAAKSEALSKKDLDRQLALNPKQFSLLSKWYQLPLFLLLAARSRFPGFPYLERKLRGKVTAAQIMNSMYALEKLGFMAREGSAIKTKIEPFVAFSSPMPNRDVQDFHREMIQRAYEAVGEQSVHERDLRAVVFSMDPSRLPEAKQVIQDFVEKFDQHFSNQAATEVCQLNLQLFWHSDLGI